MHYTLVSCKVKRSAFETASFYGPPCVRFNSVRKHETDVRPSQKLSEKALSGLPGSSVRTTDCLVCLGRPFEHPTVCLSVSQI